MSDERATIRHEVDHVYLSELGNILLKRTSVLEQRVRELERKQRYNRFVRKIWQRTVDELTVEIFEGDLGRMLLFGEKLKQYEDELRELMGITRAELEAGDDDEADEASEEEEVGTDEL